MAYHPEVEWRMTDFTISELENLARLRKVSPITEQTRSYAHYAALALKERIDEECAPLFTQIAQSIEAGLDPSKLIAFAKQRQDNILAEMGITPMGDITASGLEIRQRAEDYMRRHNIMIG